MADELIEDARLLMDRHYRNVNPEAFRADLCEKQWVVLIRDRAEFRLRGFSTIMIHSVPCDGVNAQVLFSGDTIIDRAYWGEIAMPVAYVSLVRQLRPQLPGPVYWLLTTKGFRTYRFLPVFFNTYHPDWKGTDYTFEHRLASRWAAARYGKKFDEAAGVIRAAAGAQSLRSEFAEASPERRAANPAIHYFFTRNPGWQQGDELVCAASFAEDNLTDFLRRAADHSPVPVAP
jgi:hypothetical protein